MFIKLHSSVYPGVRTKFNITHSLIECIMKYLVNVYNCLHLRHFLLANEIINFTVLFFHFIRVLYFYNNYSTTKCLPLSSESFID